MDDMEKPFTKYQLKGAYHWDEISWHPLKRNAFLIGRYKNVIKILKSEFNGNLKNKKILDLGCGDGLLTYLICREGAMIYGIDSSDIAIGYARIKTKKKDIYFQHGSAYALPYKKNVFDAVVSSDVIEHLENADKYLTEINRVVRKGGKIIISTPIRITEKLQDSMHVVEYYQKEFQSIICSKYPNSRFLESHPIFWIELTNNSVYALIGFNLLTLLKNPFEGFNSRFKYNTLQYAISTKEFKLES